MVRVHGILTTTHAVPAYGGIRLSRSVLQALADKTNAGELPMTWNHDIRRPARVDNVEAGVRRRDDGEYEAWVSYDVDEREWARFQAECEELGTPGGFSFTMALPLDDEGSLGDDRPILVKISADAAHFTTDDLRSAVEASQGARVQPQQLYQFGHDPLARVIIELLPGFFLGVPAGVLSNYLYDVLRSFVPPRRSKRSIIEIHVIETPDGKMKTLYLETPDRKALRRAVDQFGEALKAGSPVVEIDSMVDSTPDDDSAGEGA